MGIIAWIIFGLIAGIIAKVIVPGKDRVASSSPASSASWVPLSVAGSAP